MSSSQTGQTRFSALGRKRVFSNNYEEYTDNGNVFTVIVLNYTERAPLGCNI